MKKIYTAFFASLMAMQAQATKITVAVSNFSFTPQTVSATVGDTIRWVRVSDTHTTTCDGTNGTSLPSGAVTWDAPINSNNLSYEYVLTHAGTYNYVCTPHAPTMAGVLNVTGTSSIIDYNANAFLEINPPAYKSNATIKFGLSAQAHTKLTILDFSGRLCQTLINETLKSGEHIIEWQADALPQGIYFCRLETTDRTLTRKFLRVK